MPKSSAPSTHSSNVVRAVERKSMGKKKTCDEVLEPYLKAARWIPLSINPFANLTRIIYAGLPEHADGEDADDEYTNEEYLMYEDVMNLVPTFKDVLSEYAKDPSKLDTFIALLTSTANAARQEDTATLKHSIVEYMLLDSNTDTHDPPITRSHLKSARGFSHTNTASALCPVKWMEKYLKDDSAFRTKVNDGLIVIRAGDWPWFLYDNSEPLDLEDLEKGLCRGYILVRVYRHIFTGPSSATTGLRRATKSSKAQMHGLMQVTGRTIAYAAVQARFALCATEQWARFDSHFDHEAFYNNIVDLFETDPDDPWVTDTLAWWNKQVPGLAARPKGRKRVREADPASGDDEAINVIFAQRAARRKKERKQAQVAERFDESMEVNEHSTSILVEHTAAKITATSRFPRPPTKDTSPPTHRKPQFDNTSDDNTSDDDEGPISHKENPRTVSPEQISSSTSIGRNPGANPTSAASRPTPGNIRPQADRALSTRYSPGPEQRPRGRAPDPGTTHPDDEPNSPPPHKQGTRGRAGLRRKKL